MANEDSEDKSNIFCYSSTVYVEYRAFLYQKRGDTGMCTTIKIKNWS